MFESKIIQRVKEILNSNEELREKYITDRGGVKRNLVSQDIKKYDEKLLTSLLKDDLIKKSYTSIIDGTTIFKADEFSETFLYKEYWEDSYTKFSNKIGLTSSGKFIDESTDVVLDFPYKDTVLKAGMSKEDVEKKDLEPNEPFLNETLAKPEIDELFEPKILVNAKKYDKDGDHKVTEFSEKDNLIIKGNNLIALHSLEKKYAGKIKVILIDPPYNTGSDSFKYNDNFSNSTWLTFMKNRLEISKKLLSDNGVILISIDENEEAYLKVLCDNIFGKNNFIQNFHIQVRYGNKSLNEKNDFQPIMEYVLAYGKNKNLVKPNKPSKPYDMSKFNLEIKEKDPDKSFEISNHKVDVFMPGSYEINKQKNVNNDFNLFKETWVTGSIYSNTGHGKMYQKVVEPRRNKDGLGCLYKIYGLGEDGLGYRYMTGPQKENAKYGKMYNQVPVEKRNGILDGTYSKSLPIINYYDFSPDYGNIRQEGHVAFNGGKKPEKMLKMFIQMFSNKDDIVLDFHLGSGSTAAAAHKLKRRYIGIEQMNYVEDKAVTRLKNVIQGDKTGISKEVNWQGGGSFVYAELMEKNQGYLDDISNASNLNELNRVYDRMKDNVDFDFRVDLDSFEKDKDKLSFEDQRDMLVKIIDKNQLYYNEANIDDENLHDILSDDDFQFNKSFYGKEDDLNA